MIKKLLVLSVLSIVLNSCSKCDDCSLEANLRDATNSDDPNFNIVTIKNICDEKSPDLIIPEKILFDLIFS